MSNKINSILKEVLKRIDPPEEDLEFIETNLKLFLLRFNAKIKKLQIDAEVFIGGSFAKKTVIKKDIYDIDVFVRFNPNYKDEEISKLLKKLLAGFKNKSKIHGSRDYYRIKSRNDFFIELIPVRKINNPKQARNVTDLSYSHVNYIKKKVKIGKMQESIKLAKAFCYANGTYGAESYINGFSGYSLELLVYNYKGFVKFVKAMAKLKTSKDNQLVLDIEKNYKNKNRVLMDMNASKLSSPIILVDPTYPQRNALAALSNETFEKFQAACKSFLKNPSIKAFELEKVDLEKVKSQAEKKGLEFIQLTAKTDKQVGDIAGSKLLKFFKYLGNQINRYFEIQHNGFGYDNKQSATYYFVVKSRKELLLMGPFTKDKKAVAAFKKAHKKSKITTKNGRVYAKDKVTFNLSEFIEDWLKNKNNKVTRKEMSVTSLSLL